MALGKAIEVIKAVKRKKEGIVIMNRIFLPIALGLSTAVVTFITLSSSNLIQGISQKKHTEIKGISTSTTPSLTPTVILTPTLEVKKESIIYKQPVEEYISPTVMPSSAAQVFNQQTTSQQAGVAVESSNSNGSVYEPPKDSQGIVCWSNTSHCKYECKDPDGWIDVWVDNISFYVDRSKYTTDENKLQEYKNEINDKVSKLINSCGEEKVRQWVQF